MTMQTTRITTFAAAAIALPLLVGCGQGAEPAAATDASPSQATTQATSTTAEGTASSSARTTGSRARP
ncbi:hypothetical protein [Kocuria varians]|nr:hypothetical protein [Kocuria varians]